MNLVEITSQKDWDSLVSSLPYAQFTQSFAWGELQAAMGRDVRRYFIHDGSANAAAIQLIKQARAVISGYWIAPRGPVGKINAALMKFLEKALDLPNAMFIRVEPLDG